MKKLFLAAGVAALAMSVPVAADPGKNERGKGRDRGAVKADRGGGGERVKKVQERRSEAVKKNREQRVERGKKASKQRAKLAQKANDRRSDQSRKAREQRLKQAEKVQERRFERAEKNNERAFEARKRFAERRNREDFRSRDFDRERFERRFALRGLPASFSCPPGLHVAPNVCMPPGQYKKLEGRRLPAAFHTQALPTRLRNYYRDDDDHYWRFGNGFAYKVDRDEQLVRSVLPLIGAGLGIGMPFPYNSSSYHVPTAYQPFYRNTSDDYYRYANGYVYEIDRSSGMIEDMIPLLDQGYGVGQMLPSSYSYYNLPYQYRSHYRDDDDYMYRYAPGAIYQVDRETQLITAVASLLTGSSNGLAVGQPLPMGYDAYNVPYAYRERYYDTPDSLYRYSNGNIYQVDPTTRLITAIVDAIV